MDADGESKGGLQAVDDPEVAQRLKNLFRLKIGIEFICLAHEPIPRVGELLKYFLRSFTSLSSDRFRNDRSDGRFQPLEAAESVLLPGDLLMIPGRQEPRDPGLFLTLTPGGMFHAGRSKRLGGTLPPYGKTRDERPDLLFERCRRNDRCPVLFDRGFQAADLLNNDLCMRKL